MARLSKVTVTKKDGTAPLLKVQAGVSLKFSDSAALLLGLKKGDQIDVYAKDGKFYIAVVQEKTFSLSEDHKFTSTTIHAYLKEIANEFVVSEETLADEGYTWNRLIPVTKEENKAGETATEVEGLLS